MVARELGDGTCSVVMADRRAAAAVSGGGEGE
jgi:hypothetical protein